MYLAFNLLNGEGKMNKFISLFCATVLLLLALLPQFTFAEESTSIPPSGSFIVSSEAPFYDAMDKKELGILSTGSTVDYAKTEDGEVYIQWGDHLAYLNVDKVDFDENQETSPKVNESNPIGDIEVLKDTNVYSLDGKKLAAVKAGMEYPYESIDEEGNYQVIIGGQLSYFSKEDVKIVQEDSNGEQPADDNGQTDTVEPPDTTHQTTSSKDTPDAPTKSSEKDAKVINPQKDSVTAKVTFGDYFKVSDTNVPVYTNQRGAKLVQIGSLEQGQVYKRVGDSTSWHTIQFEGGYGYVKKSQTVPDGGKSIDNLNTNYQNTTTKIKVLKNAVVYDNASGKLVPFATIQKGEQYPIVTGNYTSWYRVLVSGRVGYINKSDVQAPAFTAQDKFFRVTEDKVPVYTNQRGAKLVQIGSLEKGQVYERVGDSTSWHTIQFEGGYGYVKKSQTVPDDGKSIDNLNTSYQNTTTKIKVLKNAVVYDNTSGKLVPFATIQTGEQYPVVTGNYTSWYRVLVSGRVGYINKSDVQAPAFTAQDKFFRVTEDKVPVYTNQRGAKLVQIGSLEKGQAYERVGDSTSWHKIQFEGGYGYVKKSQTVPDDGKSIDNLNTSYKNTTTKVEALKSTVVYDNTSGKLVSFATIQKGEQYPVVTGIFTNWYRVLVSGRVGYINKSDVQTTGFTAQDKFFRVTEDKVPVYTNQRGAKLVQIGSLEKGQAYERVGDSTSWHTIQFEGGYGYVKKSQTVPDDGKSIHNLNTSYKNTTTKFTVLSTTVVYDNTSGKLVPFATIQKGEQYPVVTGIFTNWYRIVVAGRVGYVDKADVKLMPTTPTKSTSFISTHYNTTLDGMVDKEMGRSPQTDQVIGYLREDAFGKLTGSTGIVSGDGWRVRGGPSTSEEIVGTLQNGHQVNILGETKVGSFSWYEVKYVVPFENAFENEVDYFVDPANFARGTSAYYQFLKLSSSANIDVSEVNQKILAGKGILAGEAQAFVNAAKQFNVNEIYLMSHALLETGNGTSKLATGGFVIQGKKVYNMYGIDATDSCPQCGAQYAYDHGWFTPAAAIMGGAQFIDTNYILAGQDTLYKMRWNPNINNLGHQYATDIGWAVKQTASISNLYSLLDTYHLVFDIPVYQAAG